MNSLEVLIDWNGIINILYVYSKYDTRSPVVLKLSLDVHIFSATTDLKWFEWIEEHFNVASLQGRKITFEQFKETLQLEQV